MQEPELIEALVLSTKDFDNQLSNLIASFIYLELLIDKGQLMRIGFGQEVSNQLMDAIKLKILQGADWNKIGRTLNIGMSMATGDISYLEFSEEQLRETFHPDNVELSMR